MKILKKSGALLLGLVLAIGIAGCSSTEEKPYPSKTIELVVPYAAGGQVDIAARILAKYVSEYLPEEQSVIVVNKPGVGGTLAMEYMLSQPADGYCLAVTTNGPMTTTPLMQSADYESSDVLPIMQLATIPNFLCVANDAPIQTPEDWLSYVEAGNEFKYSMIGIGATQHITMEQVNRALDVKTVPIPYDGDPEARMAMLQGNVDGCLTCPTNYDGSQFKLLINVSGERSALFPDVPTLKELGVDVEGFFNIVLAGQPDLPQDVLDVIDEAFKAAMEDPRVIEEMTTVGLELSYADRDTLSEQIQITLDTNVPILKDLELVD